MIKLSNIYAVNAFMHDSSIFISTHSRLFPIRFHMFRDHKLLFGIGEDELVYDILKEDPSLELLIYKDDDYLTIKGEACFEDGYEAIALKRLPELKRYYNSLTQYHFHIFSIKDMIMTLHNKDKESILLNIKQGV